MLRVALAQIDPVVGDFERNVKKIKDAYSQALKFKARILVTPELAINGYPPHDLMERPEIFERNERALQDLLGITLKSPCALAVGHVAKNMSSHGRPAFNRLSVIENGQIVFSQNKSLLPTYDVFDEARYFEPADKIDVWDCDGKKVAFGICEDFWAHDEMMGRKYYSFDPVEEYCRLGANLVISASASPYEWGKRQRREDLHLEVVKKIKCPLLYLNQVGATDEILFDGGSFAASAGKIDGRLPFFKEALGVIDVSANGCQWVNPKESLREDHAPEEIEILLRALVSGIKEYFSRTGFKRAILGLSGGIDSSVVAVLAAQALGPENVIGVAMPSQYSASMSLDDAEELAKNLRMRFEVKPIKFLYSTLSREISDGRGTLKEIALENLQSRLRGMILMALANHENALVLTTGNKSEIATGYCTIYGDMVGALAPLGDIFKTRVYELARYMNKIWNQPIPPRSIERPPSAELKPNQTDQDTLPPYEQLDELLAGYLEQKREVSVLRSQFGPWIDEVIKRVEANEYKRRQGAPVLKTSMKAFGIGRRVPIAKIWGPC